MMIYMMNIYDTCDGDIYHMAMKMNTCRVESSEASTIWRECLTVVSDNTALSMINIPGPGWSQCSHSSGDYQKRRRKKVVHYQISTFILFFL